MQTNCFRFAPRDSVPGLIAKICKYLKDHPGWSEEELEEQIKHFIGQTGVESFNGRTGVVTLNNEDVNSLKIATAYFAVDDETIASLDLSYLYAQGARFVFTNYNDVTGGYDLTFVLEFNEATGKVVYHPLTSGGGGSGSVLSVNGKTGIVEIDLADVLGDSGAQVKLCTADEFTANTLATWNAYYDAGFRLVGVVNEGATAIDYIYLLKQDENNHSPIGLSTGASDAYTPNNPPPYPVTSVNGETGDVVVTNIRYSSETPDITGARMVLISGRIPYLQTYGSSDSNYAGMEQAVYFNHVEGRLQARVATPSLGTKFMDIYSSLNPPPYPVTRVNNQTGDVYVYSLYATPGKRGFEVRNKGSGNANPYFLLFRDTDTGATQCAGLSIGENQLITNIYDEDGKWSYAYNTYSERNPPPYPVKSVNGKTGSVSVGNLTCETITVNNDGANNFDISGLVDISKIRGMWLPHQNGAPVSSTISVNASGYVTVRGIYSDAIQNWTPDSMTINVFLEV